MKNWLKKDITINKNIVAVLCMSFSLFFVVYVYITGKFAPTDYTLFSVPPCENPMDANSLEFKNLALKNFLKAYHKSDNVSAEEDIKWKRSREYKIVKRNYNDLILANYSYVIDRCHGDKKPDNECEFYSMDKKINLDYLVNLSNQICNGNKAIEKEKAKKLINFDDFNIKLIYPWDDNDDIIISDGSLKYNIVYQFESDEISTIIDNLEFVENDKKIIVYIQNHRFKSMNIKRIHDSLFASEIDEEYDDFCDDMFRYKEGNTSLQEPIGTWYFEVDKCGSPLMNRLKILRQKS